MVRPNNRRNGSRRLPNNNRRGRSSKSSPLKTSINGRVIQPSADPTSFSRQPWNSINLDLHFSQAVVGTTIPITPATLNAALISQLGIATGTFEFRVQSLRTWNLTGGAVGMRVFDFFGNNETLFTQVDYPGRNRWAKTGFVMPSTQRNNVLIGTSATPVVAQVEADTAGNTIRVYASVLWRFLAGAPIPTLFSTFKITNDVPPSGELDSFLDLPFNEIQY